MLLNRSFCFLSVLLGLSAAGCSSRELSIYFVDVNGGAATLMVTPRGETVLVDCGSAGDRDADRIAAAVEEATGRRRIDHLVTTHWHLDHYGGIEPLAERVEIGHFYDRGIPEETLDDPAHFPTLIAAYKRVVAGKPRSVLEAGEEIVLEQLTDRPALRLVCLMASGERSRGGRRPTATNPLCDQHEARPVDTGENGLSIVLLLSYGEFDFLNAGDLTWNFERDLVCPDNIVGKVELMQVPHHGLAASSNPVFIHAVQPQVAVCCNAPNKGGAAEVYQTFLSSPGFEDYWQLHRNARLSADQQPSPNRVANWNQPEGGTGIEVDVFPERGEFRVSATTTPRAWSWYAFK